ncbi:MAG: hypothetical protein IJC07_01810 [Clostridia bacterium]|nr:hypothetical protein [Clostridia bacterium]
MLTARRSNESSNYATTSSNASVQVLERPETYEEINSAKPAVDNSAAIEMHKNLEKLLNYDRYAEQMQEEAVKESIAVENVVSNVSEDDIRPTSTTMQFGEDIDSIREEMNMAKQNEEQTYRLNNKGRVVVVLYSLIVAVVMALIVLNSGVLSNLSNQNELKAQELSDAMQTYSQVQMDIDRISSEEYIDDRAVELGMEKR